ncbi:MAG: succinate dehydrogenase cytochrome b subunit [Bdellovibrionales bacterium]|nr:succinate dehydrogenase cytochrome b subunit [Bdellovibrionales bacterium]
MSVCTLWRSSIVKKWLVAITGLVMVGFLLGHMAGNLQMFLGRGPSPEATKINEYAAFLKANPALLWGTRIVLLFSVLLHIVTTISLTRQNRKARPESYALRASVASNLASRTMIFGGLTLLFYIIYHLLHFTLGCVHQELFTYPDVYQTVLSSFQIPLISGVYIVAQIALYFHLVHGISSAGETLGVSHPRYRECLNRIGIATATLICGGFISIPVGVLTGLIS